jgi:parallel beta-helix repeat protein
MTIVELTIPHGRRDGSGGASPIRRTLALVLLALATTLAVPASPAGADTFAPEADSYVDASVPSTNFGTRITLRTDASPEVRSYVRFNVEGTADTSSATLRIFANTSNNLGFDVRAADSNDWGETTLNFGNAPSLGPVLDSSGPVTGGNWYEFDVSAALTGTGRVSFAITSASATATSLGSRESSNPPQLIVPGTPPPAGPSPFVVSREGDAYRAVSSTTGTAYSGTLKFVVESAVRTLMQAGGGTVMFGTGLFDLGSDRLKFDDADDIEFAGAGVEATVIQNSSNASADTEPFDMHDTDRIIIRDMTVNAGGTPRSTSDVMDFDGGNDVIVERVKITASRGRGIVFDGKDFEGGLPRTADRNVVRDCVITGIPGDGIELLASSNNRVERCTITGVGGHGMQIAKAGSGAAQPNKMSNDNVITGNVIDESGQNGIEVTGGDRNLIDGNTVTNSSDDITGRDGIRITTSNSVPCNDNVVRNNRATDTQVTKTQAYGLNIVSPSCNRTVVGPGNDFSGNRTAPIRDRGTNTQYV